MPSSTTPSRSSTGSGRRVVRRHDRHGGARTRRTPAGGRPSHLAHPSTPTTGGPPVSQYLKDKVVVVTGAAAGFGRLIAEKCAAGRAKVVVLDIDEAGLEAVAQGIRVAGGQATHLAVDVVDLAQVEAGGTPARRTLRRGGVPGQHTGG